MAKKTNKTSHVMDLLTNGASAEGADSTGEAAAAGQEKKSDVQSHTVTPAKVTVVDEGSRNDRISQEILGKLTEELEAETSQARQDEAAEEISVSQPDAGEESAAEVQAEGPVQESDAAAAESAAPAGDSADEVQTEAVSDASEGVSQASDSAAGEDTPDGAEVPPEAPQAAVKPEPAASPTHKTGKAEAHPIIPTGHFTSRTENKEYRFVNVMEQLLMRQDLDAVLKQHNVCNCPRCMSDVCALALTGLPSKYVVTSKDSISPLLSYYENKYRIPVLTELMKACNKVRENPRHKLT